MVPCSTWRQLGNVTIGRAGQELPSGSGRCRISGRHRPGDRQPHGWMSWQLPAGYRSRQHARDRQGQPPLLRPDRASQFPDRRRGRHSEQSGCIVVAQGLTAALGMPYNVQFAALAAKKRNPDDPQEFGPKGTWRPQGQASAPRSSNYWVVDTDCVSSTDTPNTYCYHFIRGSSRIPKRHADRGRRKEHLLRQSDLYSAGPRCRRAGRPERLREPRIWHRASQLFSRGRQTQSVRISRRRRGVRIRVSSWATSSISSRRGRCGYLCRAIAAQYQIRPMVGNPLCPWNIG